MFSYYKTFVKQPVVVAILAVTVIGTAILYVGLKGLDEFHASNRRAAELNNASNCLGQFRTIECYQFKIDQLKLEQSYQRKLNGS